MKFKCYILIGLTLLLFNSTCAQVTQEWVRNYPGLLNEGANAIKVLNDNDNNVYVLGDCSIFVGTNFRDLVLLKYNSAGIEQWVKTYNNPNNTVDIAGAMTLDNSGNVIITGKTEYLDTGFFSTVKYNSNGTQNWAVQYNSNPPSQLYNSPVAIHTDNSSNVYVTALSSYQQQVSDYFTIKYNSSGTELWSARFNDGADYPYDMNVDNLGNVYVTGYSTSDSTGYDIKTVKYNSGGNFQWVQKYQSFLATPTNSECKLILDNNGNVYVAGTCYGPFGLWDLVLIKYLPDGSQSWIKYYGGSGYDRSDAITIDFQNNIYVTGFKIVNGEAQTVILRYNSSGDLTKEIIYDGPGNNDNSTDIKTDSHRNVYVTGYVNASGSSNTDFFTVSYDSSGAQRWVKLYNGNGNGMDKAYSLSLDNNNNVYVTGYTKDTSFNVMTTIKYSQTIGIQTISNELPQKFSLSQNYPNPFNPSTNINFEIARTSNVKLVVYDALGREVSVLANETMKPGIYSASFDAEGLNSGVYFYSLITDGFKETKKMILLK
ncbi:MAG: SBBP repeat-containing protein [Ignavibacteriae bacterium]|nr:SBBP repeat-containing protein [Ignavibacteriota bacterium]